MAGSFIPSAIFQGATELIRSRGRQAAPLARRCGVPLAALSDPDLLVPARAALNFFEHAAEACGDRTWGLKLASHARLAAIIGPLWILLRNARTVREMCQELAGNFDLYTNAALMRFEPLREGALLSWSTTTGQTDSEVQMAEYALAVFCDEIRTHCAPGWQPRAVLFRHAALPSLRLHRKLFGEDLRFDQDCNALLLDDATLSLALQGRASHARTLIRTVLRADDELGHDDNVALRVESVVRALMPFAPCTLRDVSLAMGLPPRTLQARLQSQGRSFKDIKDAVRADLALKYLQHSRMSAVQIAEVLGYTDPTSFSRSFRRWHGHSARQTRSRKRGLNDGMA